MPAIDRIRENAGRIARDVEHATRGNFDRISEETRRDVAEAIRDHMEGRTRVRIPVNERVHVEGYRERDGTVGGRLIYEF